MTRARIAALYDTFRKTFEGGRVLITAGVSALPPILAADVLEKVRTFTDFTLDNDPYGEHDFGSLELESQKFSPTDARRARLVLAALPAAQRALPMVARALRKHGHART